MTTSTSTKSFPAATTTTTDAHTREAFIRVIPASYSWKRHVMLTFSTGVALMILPLFFVGDWSIKLLWAVAAIWVVVAPPIEYAAHRWLLHTRLVRRIHYDHAEVHHPVYDGRATLAFEDPRELRLILMPWWAIALFGVMFAIMSPAAYWFFGRDYALVATAAGFAFVTWYEARHMLIHWPLQKDSLFYRFIHWERTHWHHHQKDKTRYFGVVLPWVDWLIELVRAHGAK